MLRLPNTTKMICPLCEQEALEIRATKREPVTPRAGAVDAECKHHFVLRDTHKRQSPISPVEVQLHRSDFYFCHKCLDVRERITEGSVKEGEFMPSWYQAGEVKD
jgi:Zn finger protein HypA/HybF involved in hydrogenase expression